MSMNGRIAGKLCEQDAQERAEWASAGLRTASARGLPHRVVQLAIGIFGHVEAGLAPGDDPLGGR